MQKGIEASASEGVMMRPKTVRKPTTKQATSLSETLLPLLAQMIESGNISVRVGRLSDLKEWLNDSEAFEITQVIIIEAASIRVHGNELQIDHHSSWLTQRTAR
jgi:hypothetical protein